jgi:RHS repeat-associated protein
VHRSVGGVGTYYAYDAMGNLVAEYGTPTGDSGTFYLTADMVGSMRLVTDAGGAPKLCYDYMPFGTELCAGINARPSNCFVSDTFNTKFTGMERDSESGLDNMIARYFSSAQGRFMGADGPFNDQNSSDPQSWNLFAYGRNNPLRYVDPSGQFISTSQPDGAERGTCSRPTLLFQIRHP